MSVDQIENQIRQLSMSDVARLTKWLTEYLASQSGPNEEMWLESNEQRAELERRLNEFLENPSIATPFESDYFTNLKRQFADERSKKASTR